MKPKAIVQQVKKTYTAIADEFDATRKHSWPEFDLFLEEIRKHAIFKKRLAALGVLDVGCGNGRLFDFLTIRQAEGDIKVFVYIGVDNNPALIRIAKKKHPKAVFRLADATRLPFLPHSFDIVWCIAVLHHLPTEKLRLAALKKMKRVLKKNGMLCCMVWNLRKQPKYKKYMDSKTHDGFIPWGSAKKQKRYYHAFSMIELRKLLRAAGFHTIKKIKSRYNLAFICYS